MLVSRSFPRWILTAVAALVVLSAARVAPADPAAKRDAKAASRPAGKATGAKPAGKAPAVDGRTPFPLRYNLVKGNLYTLHTSTELTQNSNFMGRANNARTLAAFGTKLKVLDVDKDGIATITFTFASVRYEEQNAFGTLAYDSKKDADKVPSGAEPYAALVGESVEIRLGPLGHVKSVKGADTLVQHMLAKMPRNNGFLQGFMDEAIKGQFSENGIRDMIEAKTSIYPNKPVKIGDDWTRKTTVNRGMAMAAETTYTLKAIKNGRAILAADGKMAADGSGNVAMEGMKMTINASGKRTGTLEVDVETGWILKADVEENYNGSLDMDAQGQRMSLPTSGSSHLKMTGNK